MARRKQAFEDGDVIYREGAPAGDAYEVQNGAVELLRDDTAAQANARSFQASRVFDEMGLADGGAREVAAPDSVQGWLTQRDQVPPRIPSAARKAGVWRRLIKRIGSTGAPLLTPGVKSVGGEGPRFVQRMAELVQPLEGRIEARVAPFTGDPKGQVTKQVIAAFDRFRDVHARPMRRPLEINADKDLGAELASAAKLARRWLKGRQADILIWGHVPPTGASVHIHFISLASWDQRMPGGFDLTTDLPLPIQSPIQSFGPFSDFLHAATLSAAVPASRDKAKMRVAMLPDAAVAAGASMDDLAPNLTIRERAALYLCYGNILTAMWAAKRQPEFMDQAITAYRHVSAAVERDQAPVHWATAHKHLSSLLYLRADAARDKAGYEESATAALSALEVLTKDETPYEWAAMQHRLGLIHYRLGDDAGHADILSQALRRHLSALEVYSKRRTTARWAEAMSGFARAAQVFGEHVKSLEAMTTAANAYHAVLQVRDRETSPLAWAATQNNLGGALFWLGKKANDPARIKAAIDAFEAALDVYALHGKRRQTTVAGKNLERARKLLEHVSPKDYLSRELMEPGWPFSENPGSRLVDVSDIGADISGGSTVH